MNHPRHCRLLIGSNSAGESFLAIHALQLNGDDGKESAAFRHADVANRRVDGSLRLRSRIFNRRNCSYLRSMDVFVQVWTLTATAAMPIRK